MRRAGADRRTPSHWPRQVPTSRSATSSIRTHTCPTQPGAPATSRRRLVEKFGRRCLTDVVDVRDIVRAAGWHKLPVAAIEPVEVSNAIVYLASDKARYVSGGTIDVGAG